MSSTTEPAPGLGSRFSGAQHKVLAFSGLIVLMIAFSLASPNFLTTANIITILQATSVNGVLAVAATLVIISGGIDLSVGRLMTFCAVVAGVSLTCWGLPIWIGAPGALADAICAVAGILIASRINSAQPAIGQGYELDAIAAVVIGGAGKVAIVSFDQTSQTGIERRDGFVAQIEAAHPDIEIVAIEYGGGDHLRSAEITKALLQAYPDLKGIFGANEGSAIGVAIGKKEVGSDVIVVGYDSGKAQIDAVRDGTIAGAITQNPVGIGYETVKAALAAIKGEAVPAHIDTGFYWYDQTNIDDPVIAAVLYD